MPATKTQNPMRELEEQRAPVAEQLAQLSREVADAETRLKDVKGERAAGTATPRDVSLAQLDLEQLRQERADKETELQRIVQQIADLEAAKEAKRLHGVRVRRIVELSATGSQAFSDFEKHRAAAHESVTAAAAAYVEQIDAQRAIRGTLDELVAEGLTLKDVVREVEAAGADLKACNVGFCYQRLGNGPGSAAVENGPRPLSHHITSVPVTPVRSTTAAAKSIDAALKALGVPLP